MIFFSSLSFISSLFLINVIDQTLAARISPPRIWKSFNSSITEPYVGTLISESVDKNFCDPSSESYSGYFEIKGGKNLNHFYWFFESRNDPENDPLVMWLSGGPGCSSTLALFSENGPCDVTEDGQDLFLNPYSWTNNASVIWLDQPTGVGYSYGDEEDYRMFSDESGEDLFQFMQAFYEQFPQYRKTPFHLFGESYAGHYVPAAAYAINEHNRVLPEDGKNRIPLASIGIGNGFTDPANQYKTMPKYYTENIYNNKIVTPKQVEEMYDALPNCLEAIKECQKEQYNCISATKACSPYLDSPFFESPENLNSYDIRIKCEVPGLCYDFSRFDVFLNKPEVLKALHVNTKEKEKWEICDRKVYQDFLYDKMLNYAPDIATLLESDIDVLIFAGDADFICNWMGNKAWTLDLLWKGKEGFNAAEDKKWIVNNKHWGNLRSYKNFYFLEFFEAGHLVPMDQPEVSLHMLNTFIRGKLQ